MLRKMALVALLLPRIAAADLPNHFNPKELASEGIWVGVDSCVRSMPENFKAQLGKAVVLEYCNCSIDAVRAKGQEKVTVADLQLCWKRASASNPSRPARVNPFNRKQWSSERILLAISECEGKYKATKGEQLDTANRIWSFCSCMVDAYRVKSVEKVSLTDAGFCLEQARKVYPKDKSDVPHG